MYGCYVRFTAQPGQRDALAEHLLRAAASVHSDRDCLLYYVSTSPTDPDAIWVTEVWTSEGASERSLDNDVTRAAIQEILPLLAGRPEKIPLRPLGGKGLPQDTVNEEMSHEE